MKPRLRLPFDVRPRITFNFGEAPEWYTKVFGYPHNGVDFGMKTGTSIKACDDGKVIYSDTVPDSNGCGIIMSHDWGRSLYWHLSKLIAKSGSLIRKGATIGLSGATGFVTGPHLHWGIKVDDVPSITMRGWTDPMEFLAKPPVGELPPKPIFKYHLVRPGESLWSIAVKYYAAGALWRRIYDVNRDKIFDPGLIFPFQRLLIP